MKRRARPVTDAELDVLKSLWQLGPTTIRELTDRLYPAGSTAHYATVQKLLDRLEDKGCVKRRPRGRQNEFLAAIDRESLIASRLLETAERLCDGSLTPILTELVSSAELSKEELEELREIVARAGKRTPRGER